MIAPVPRVFTFGASIVAAFSVALHAQEPEIRNYKLRIDTPAKMEMHGEQVNAARYEVQYTWRHSGQSRTLVVNQVDQKYYFNGREIQILTTTRERISGGIGGKFIVQILQDSSKASPETQAVHKCFNVPLATLQLDQQGRENSRKIHSIPGAKFFQDHMLIVGLIFHSPFPGDRTEWQSPFELSFGEHYAKGPLTYKKVDTTPHTYAISGVLQDSTKTTPYAATGQQTFDPVTQAWIHGKLRLSVNSRGRTEVLADITLETVK